MFLLSIIVPIYLVVCCPTTHNNYNYRITNNRGQIETLHFVGVGLNRCRIYKSSGMLHFFSQISIGCQKLFFRGPPYIFFIALSVKQFLYNDVQFPMVTKIHSDFVKICFHLLFSFALTGGTVDFLVLGVDSLPWEEKYLDDSKGEEEEVAGPLCGRQDVYPDMSC